jgi:two-component system sensor histidine kinase QseC
VRFTPQIDKGARRDQTSTATVGEVILVVASERKSLDKTLATFAFVLSSAGLLLLIATGMIVPRVLQKELLPLDQLAEQASRIDAESLSIRFETELLPTELHPIGSRLNDLLERLEQAFDRERQFSGDLAHELRTPIAELRSLAELGLQWPQTRGAETDRDALAIAQQMEHIVTRLLGLLRSENKQLIVQREPVRLAALIQSVWSSFTAKAAEKELEVTCTVADDAVIQSDLVLLHSILSNLFDNAVEYTPQRSVVRIESEADSERFLVRVVNTARELHPGDIPKLFQRFWRKDMARSGGNHSGLGLSLAKGFSQALGYGLTASQDSSPGFLTITLAGTVRGPDRSIPSSESSSVSEIEATVIHQ